MMNQKRSLKIILLILILGFSTGFYMKFIKSFSVQGIQLVKENPITGEKTERPIRLGDLVRLLNNIEDRFEKEIENPPRNFKEDVVVKTSFENPNKKVLFKLKALNYISILLMIVSIIIAGLIIKKLLDKEV